MFVGWQWESIIKNGEVLVIVFPFISFVTVRTGLYAGDVEANTRLSSRYR